MSHFRYGWDIQTYEIILMTVGVLSKFSGKFLEKHLDTLQVTSQLIYLNSISLPYIIYFSHATLLNLQRIIGE